MDPIILFCLIVLIIVFAYNLIHKESFSHSTGGALQQLQAKDVQDINITVGTEKYLPYYGYYPIWNAPTRYPPYLYYYPYYYYYPSIYNYSPYWRW